MRKLYTIFLMLATVLLVSNFMSISRISSLTNTSNTISSSDTLAPPSVFPTNATFQTKAEVVGNDTIASIGGAQGSSYYAQSFKALSDYIVNGGLWLEKYSYINVTTPSFRLLLCNNTDSGRPAIASPIAMSQNITGATIDARPGRFYLNLTEPIKVLQNQTYWLVIDGYMDNVTDGEAQSRWQNANPYKDGGFAYSNDAGLNWQTPFLAIGDLDFVVTFSSRPSKVESFGTDFFTSIGGQFASDYYAQSFKALDSYIVDAGIWIEKYSEPTPSVRIQIWLNNASGYPDKDHVIASSRVIKGNEINASMGERFFVHPNVSIPVVKGDIYWLILDGFYDQTSSGFAGSRGSYFDAFADGQFLYSNNAGETWNAWAISDLNFIVDFSASQSAIKMMKGDSPWSPIGGNGLNNLDYVGQSFKALNKFILDAGIWLQNSGNFSLSIRLLISDSTIGNASQPDLVNYVARSIPITVKPWWQNGSGMYYLQPTRPIQVIPGHTYFFIVDGYSLANATASSLTTYDRYQSPDGPYKDGVETYSKNAGASWGIYAAYDLGLDVTFSDVPYEAQCGSTDVAWEIGWQATTPYFAQSFIALNDYISDAGIWLAPRSGQTPNLRLLLVGNNATDYDHPDLNDVLATSLKIEGTDIASEPGMYFIKPSVPVPVQIFGRYWIVIDGSYDKVTNGTAASRSVNYDAYPDGEFLWARQDLSLGWGNDIANHRYDLQFDVLFTHVNQPPSAPGVLISPQSPLDSDNLVMSILYPSTDLEQDTLTYHTEWYRNGVPQPELVNTDVVPKSATNATDDWTVKLTPNDGHIDGFSGYYTVHVQADILTIDHPIILPGDPTYHIFTTSNTTVTSFDFNYTVRDQPAKIAFTSTGASGAEGFVNVSIPKTLVNVFNPSDWMITINGNLVPHAPPQVVITENATYTFISLKYSTSSVPITIQGLLAVPEFTTAMLVMTLAIITIALALVFKKVGKRRQ